jgi:nicotinamidase-related amidase
LYASKNNSFEVNFVKKLLIVVDYQNDFVNGSLGFEKAAALERPIVDKIAEYRRSGGEIVFTLDTHTTYYLNTQEGRNLPVVHCVEGTEGWNLFGKVAELKRDSDKVFKKPVFGSSDLLEYLKDREYESIELVGVVSNICVISNAVLAKTAQPETPVIVDAACVASNDDDLNEAALNVMESMHVKVTNRKPQ